ncbi:hypothetical protein ACO22_07031 [Paracoccidioides brasiliensis]|uniref:Uncharacterized protein n=1 Tax=Paracoccidioides brasiliensis TaxID=121759 RepID=A0A1D2J5S7_PARBR|nr:hypothetical protein ACO22_07031 [Paracoccidioides brasiliensis]
MRSSSYRVSDQDWTAPESTTRLIALRLQEIAVAFAAAAAAAAQGSRTLALAASVELDSVPLESTAEQHTGLIDRLPGKTQQK